MKLNIYKKKQIIKTYEAETYDLMYGTVKDVMTVFDVDGLKTGSDVEIIKMVVSALPKCTNIIDPLLKDIFDGLTDEDLKNVKMKEIASVLVEVIKYAFSEMSLGVDPKN